MFKRLLLATDGSALSRKAELHAIDLAVALGAELVVLQVAPKLSRTLLNPTVTAARLDLKDVEKFWVDAGNDHVAKVVQKAERAGASAKGIVTVADDVARSIIATAEKQQCDLVVMASHGRKGLERLLIGSETQHVLTHGEVPVLVVRG